MRRRPSRGRPRHLCERYDIADQRAARDRVCREEASRFLEVGALVDARPDQGQLAPEHAEEIDGRRRRVDAHHHRPPVCPQATYCGTHAGLCAGDLERHGRARACRPLVDPARGVLRKRVDRGVAERCDDLAPALVGSKTATSAPAARATVAISSPIGPAPMTTARSPAVSPERRTSCTATAVGSASAAVCNDRCPGRRMSTPAGTFQWTASTRARRCRERSARSRCARRR